MKRYWKVLLYYVDSYKFIIIVVIICHINFDLSLKMHHDDQARLQSHRKYVRIFFSFYKHYSKFIIITQFDNKTKKTQISTYHV